MRVLMLSDIHANLIALETVLSDAAGEYDTIWCLGDIVGYGPRPNECIELMREARVIFLRNGAYRWHLYEDLNQSNKFRMEIVAPSWKQHLLQRERMTKNERDIIDRLRSLRTDPNPPEEWVSLSVEKEVLNRRVRTSGLPSDYVDQ